MVAGHGVQEGRALHYIEGAWQEGNPPLLGPMTHASWMSSIVFDGARAFEGLTPDLDRHCDRLIATTQYSRKLRRCHGVFTSCHN